MQTADDTAAPLITSLGEGYTALPSSLIRLALVTSTPCWLKNRPNLQCRDHGRHRSINHELPHLRVSEDEDGLMQRLTLLKITLRSGVDRSLLIA